MSNAYIPHDLRLDKRKTEASAEHYQLLRVSPKRWAVIEFDTTFKEISREGGKKLENVLEFRQVTKPSTREDALDYLARLRQGKPLPDRILIAI